MGNLKKIAAAFKTMRNIKGIKQKDLAAALDVSASYLSVIEKGKFRPSNKMIRRYAAQFGIKPVDLIIFVETIDDPNDISISERIFNMLAADRLTND